MNHFLRCLILSALLAEGCTLSDERIIKNNWKVGELCGLTDVLVIYRNKNMRLSGDTIYKAGQPIAVITQREYRWYADNKLYLMNLKTKDTCVYYEK
jgi:hypothetical protein